MFFGEGLPKRFLDLIEKVRELNSGPHSFVIFINRCKDINECDLLIIMGTSLTVPPFSSLPGKCVFKCCTLLRFHFIDLLYRVKDNCPRLLINMQKVGEVCGGNASNVKATEMIFTLLS